MKKIRLACLLLGLLGALVLRSVDSPSALASSCGRWSIVPSPSSNGDAFGAVAAVSPSDVWAVGGAGTQPLIEHWNGTRWQVVASPALQGILGSVTALSARNAWAVGTQDHGTQTLVEHWDGSQWRIVASPNRGTLTNALVRVAALSASNIWAIGGYLNGSGSPARTLIEHWDGSTWRIVPSPNKGSYDTGLSGVTAVSPSDIWAVGGYGNRNVIRPLTQHWDGQQWKIIPTPSTNGTGLLAAASLDARHVWAVGDGPQGHPLTQRWNGSRWRIVPSPSRGLSRLDSVAARARSDLWAVGYVYDSNQGIDLTLTQHWNGTNWQMVASPNVASENNFLNGVAVVGAHEVWAVGYAYPPGGTTSTTLIEHFC